MARSSGVKRLTVVAAAPVWPEQVEALRALHEQDRLGCLILLEPKRTSGWTVFARKTSVSADYLQALGFQLVGSAQWESGERSERKLQEMLDEARPFWGGSTLPFLLLTYPQEAIEEADLRPAVPSWTGPEVGSRAPARHAPGETMVETVYGRFLHEASSRLSEVNSLDLSLELDRGPDDLRRRLQLFLNLTTSTGEQTAFLFIQSSALPHLYPELLHWCLAWASGEVETRPLLVVYESGLPTRKRKDLVGLTDAGRLLSLPGLSLASPADEEEALVLFEELCRSASPGALLFTGAPAVGYHANVPCSAGRGRQLREGEQVSLVAWGSTVYPCLLASESLCALGLTVAVYDLRYRRPIDRELLEKALSASLCVAVEEQSLSTTFAGASWPEPGDGPKGGRIRLSCPDQVPPELIEGQETLTLETFGLHAEGITRAVTRSLSLLPSVPL